MKKKTTCDDNKSQNRVKNLVEWRKRSWPKQRIEAQAFARKNMSWLKYECRRR